MLSIRGFGGEQALNNLPRYIKLYLFLHTFSFAIKSVYAVDNYPGQQARSNNSNNDFSILAISFRLRGVHTGHRIEVAEVWLAVVVRLTRRPNRSKSLTPPFNTGMPVYTLLRVKAFLTCVFFYLFTLPIPSTSISTFTLIVIKAIHANIKLWMTTLRLAGVTIIITRLTQLKLPLTLKRTTIAPFILLIAISCEFGLEGFNMFLISPSNTLIAHIAALPYIATTDGAFQIITTRHIIFQLR